MTDPAGAFDEEPITVSAPQALTLQDQALIEFGKRLFVESDEVVDFRKADDHRVNGSNPYLHCAG